MKPRVQQPQARKFKTNTILFVVLVYIGIVLVGSIPQAIMFPDGPQKGPGTFGTDALGLGSFAVIIAVTIAVMYFLKRESLSVFGGGTNKSLRALGIGAAMGLVLNGVISLFAGITGAITYQFNTFSPLILVIIPFVFIQCTAEEVLGRAFIPSFLEESHSISVIALVSSVLFMLTHVGNMALYGFNLVFCINLLLVATILYLLVKVSGNFWIAPGFHTAWNYTQQYLFGLPNSGSSSGYALFTGTNPQGNFFYNAAFGNEGSLITLIIFVIILGVLVAMLRRKKA